MRNRVVQAVALTAALAFVAPAMAQTASIPAFEARLRVLAYPPPPATVTCKDGVATLAKAAPFAAGWSVAVQPLAGDSAVAAALAPNNGAPNLTITFDITAEGRPHALNVTRALPTNGASLDAGDPNGATVAATWRFQPGRAYAGCSVNVVGRFVPLESADRATLLAAIGERMGPSTYTAAAPMSDEAMSASPTLAGMAKDAAEFRAAILPPGANCDDLGPLRPRLMAFPDWDTVPDDPGGHSWALVTYDVDADGRPTGAKVTASSGNAELDRQAVAAVGRSLFNRVARTGCLAAFRHTGPPLPWPREAPVKAPASCPTDVRPVLSDPGRYFPAAYRERGVEGWALISYDIAPWGAIGDLKVIGSEPSAAFGQAAQAIFLGATASKSPQGYSGCLQPVAFKMPTTPER